MTSITSTRKKVGEFRHKVLALFISVLLAITCLPILPGKTQEAQAETYSSAPSWTTQTAQAWRLRCDGSGLHFDFMDNSNWLIRGKCDAYNSGTQYQYSGTITALNGQQYVDGGTAYTITNITYSLKAKVQADWSGVYTAVLTLVHTGGSVTLLNNVNVAREMGNSTNYAGGNFTTYTGYVPASTAYANPIPTASPTLTATLGDTISSAGGWSSGIAAKWGHTQTNLIPSMGTISDQSLVAGTDASLSTDGVTFDRVGYKSHNYLIKDDHSNSSALQYAGDNTSATTNRNIVVVSANAPDLNITYASGATDKDGTAISPGTPYTAAGDSMYSTGWTNQNLDFELSSNDHGAYDLMLRHNGVNTSQFGSVTAPPTPAKHIVTNHGTQTPVTGDTISTIMLGTGNHAIELSPESAAQTIKIDKGMPTPAATYTSGQFNDTSTDPDGLSLIDASRQKIAVVPAGSAPPTNYNTDFKTFAAMNASNITPGYYDVYVWAWDNAGNNTSAPVLNNQLIISADAPTIAGALASGPNSGQALASNTWTNQDVEVTVTHPASITSGYATLLDGLITEVKATTVNTPASKTYTAETPGTTLDGVILDSGTTELSQHSSNYVVKIDKTDPVAATTYNGSPNYDFTDNSTDTASMMANSGVNPAKTIICFETPGTVTPPAKSKYEPLIGATLPATGWYDVWVIATDYAGNESAPIKAYDHISRSGKDEITAKDFAWDIAKGSASFDASMSQMLSHVKGIPYGSNTPFPLSQIDVDAAELAAIIAAIDAGQKGTVWDLTFSTPAGATQATTTITVTLFDSGSNVPTPPGPLTQELVFANDFNWGISTGQLTDDPARFLSQVVGYKAGGDTFATGDLGVDSGELAAINAAISAGQKNSTFPLTFTTNGSTGPAASVTINVTLFDNGPQGPIPAGSEQIVGNNFKWGIDSGDVSSAIAQHLGKIQATGATGAPMAASSISIDGAELAALNAAIAAGQVGTTWPLTFTTDGSTGTPASVTIYVTLFDAGHQTPVVGDPYIVANHFSRAVSAGALDDAAAKTDSLTEALNSIGHTGDNAHISVDAAELAVINASIAAGDVSKPPYPLTFTYSCPVSSKTVSAVALVTLTGEKNLEVTKTVDNATPVPGDTVTYTITAKNKGDVAVHGLWIKDNLPEGTIFVSCDKQGKYGATVDGKEYVHWYFAKLDPGDEVECTVKVKIDTCAPGTEIKNVALYGVDNPGLPANLDDDPKGDKTDPASITVGDPGGEVAKAKVTKKKVAKTGDTIAVAVGVGVVLLALVLLVLARRRSKRDEG